MAALLREARQKKVAVGAFNVYNYETVRGVLDAAAVLRTPVIVSFGEGYLQNMRIAEVAAMVKEMAKNYIFPLVLHLDHARSLDNICAAMAAGFTSVMFDGSSLPFEENIARTREVVSMAREAGVSVEAELGSLATGLHSDEEGQAEVYTDPVLAFEFIKQTAVDALAISIGTVHGMYRGEPKIALNVLRSIAGLVETPLVLHGGSGTPPEVLRECIGLGIAKINVNTEISVAVVERLRQELAAGTMPNLPFLSRLQTQTVSEVAERYLRLLNAIEE